MPYFNIQRATIGAWLSYTLKFLIFISMDNTNPILNNPYEPPKEYYETDPSKGSLNYSIIKKGRRIFTRRNQIIPIKQLQGTLLGVNEAASDDDLKHIINVLRKEIETWRLNGYQGVTRVSKLLLEFWFHNPDREVNPKIIFRPTGGNRNSYLDK